MPHPRPPRPIRRTKACRSNLRRKRNAAWLNARLVAKLLGVADLIERKRREGRDANGYLINEKAPDPATGGFSDPVVPAQDPGPPQIRRLS